MTDDEIAANLKNRREGPKFNIRCWQLLDLSNFWSVTGEWPKFSYFLKK